MKLSARNQIRGTVTAIRRGAVMAEITIDVDSQELTATISLGAVERLELSLGDRVTAIIKSTDVLVGK